MQSQGVSLGRADRLNWQWQLGGSSGRAEQCGRPNLLQKGLERYGAELGLVQLGIQPAAAGRFQGAGVGI